MADFWICETGTGQQVAQLHDRYDDDDDDLSAAVKPAVPKCVQSSNLFGVHVLGSCPV
jgi:hypothetical protein